MAPQGADISRNFKELPDSHLARSNDEGQPRNSGASAKSSRGNTSLDLLNENSPLLSPQQVEFQDGRTPPLPGTPSAMLDWSDDDDDEKSKSVWYLFLLTLSIGG